MVKFLKFLHSMTVLQEWGPIYYKGYSNNRTSKKHSHSKDAFHSNSTQHTFCSICLVVFFLKKKTFDSKKSYIYMFNYKQILTWSFYFYLIDSNFSYISIVLKNSFGLFFVEHTFDLNWFYNKLFMKNNFELWFKIKG